MYQYQMMYILFQGRGVVESRIPCSQTKKLKVFSDLVGVFANKRESEISSGLGKRARRKQLFLTSSKPFKTQQISDCQRWEPFLSISQMVFLSDSNRSARSISRMSSKQIWSCKMSVTWNLDQTILQKQNLTSTAQHSANHPTPGPWQWAANAWPLPGSSKQSKSCPSHFCKASGFTKFFLTHFRLISVGALQISGPLHCCITGMETWSCCDSQIESALAHHRNKLKCTDCTDFCAKSGLAASCSFQSSKKSWISHCQKRFVMLKQDACQKRKFWQYYSYLEYFRSPSLFLSYGFTLYLDLLHKSQRSETMKLSSSTLSTIHL